MAKAWLIFTTTPELKALAMAWTRELADDLLVGRKARESAKREAAAADTDETVKPPLGYYTHAQIVEVEWPS